MNSRLKMDLMQVFNDVKIKENFNEIIIVCVGTNRIIGDAYGPTVGDFLSKKISSKKVKVFGTLKKTVTYQNIDFILEKIKARYEKPCIIVIDSALSNLNYVGRIIVREGKTEIAKGIKNENKKIGDISIRAVVAENEYEYKKNFENLKNSSSKLIFNLSRITANGIMDVINEGC